MLRRFAILFLLILGLTVNLSLCDQNKGGNSNSNPNENHVGHVHTGETGDTGDSWSTPHDSHSPIDDECAVTEWTEWTDCSVSCGLGFRYRNRFFVHPKFKEHGHGQEIPEKCKKTLLTQKSPCDGQC